MPPFSRAYVELQQGSPFPKRIDPWAEEGQYFHQIHSGMITHLQDQLQDELNLRGYQVGKEASLQVIAHRKPDLYVQDTQERLLPPRWDYGAKAEALQLEAGEAVVDEELELDALHIYAMDSSELVTVVEIISPRNKTHPEDMLRYKSQRDSLFLAQGVNVVEIDATRSIRRLLSHPLTEENPYHIAIYLPGQMPRVLVNQLDEPLKPFALPLRGELVRTEPHSAYERAYQRGAIAGLIQQRSQYALEALPFPSLLAEPQKSAAIEAVSQWQQSLQRIA